MIDTSNKEIQSHYDYIVVGAGAAGSVLAAELSASGAQVLVIESGGPDDAPTIANRSIWFYNVGGPLDHHLPIIRPSHNSSDPARAAAPTRWRHSSASSSTTWRETIAVRESAYLGRLFRQSPKSGIHTRRTPTVLEPAMPSPIDSGDSGNPPATGVGPDMPGRPDRCGSSFPIPSNFEYSSAIAVHYILELPESSRYPSKMIRGYDMQDENGESDDNIWFPVC